MYKKIFDKRGEAITAAAIAILVGIVSVASLGFYKTYQSGVLKQNGKKIWCKVLNKGEAYCNAQYPHPDEVASVVE